MEYGIRIIANGRSAKNKGLISGRWTSREMTAFRLPDHDCGDSH